MKHVRLFLLVAALQSSFAMFAQDPCQELMMLIEQPTPNYSELTRLKELCAREREASSEAKILQRLNGLELAPSLQAAHKRRTGERSELTAEVKHIMSPYFDPSTRMKLGIAEDQVFSGQLREMSRLHARLLSLKTDSFESYLDERTTSAFALVNALQNQGLNPDAQAIVDLVRTQHEAFRKSSDSVSRDCDLQSEKVFNSALQTTDNYRVRAHLNATEVTREDFLKDIDPALLKVKATTTWGKYLTEAKVDSIVSSIDERIASGMIKSADERLTLLGAMSTAFLSKLPPKLSRIIQEIESYDEFRKRIENRKKSLAGLPESEILKRQQDCLAYRMSQLRDMKADCLKKAGTFQNRWENLQLEYRAFEDKVSTREQLRPRVQMFIMESFADQMDILLDLCQGLSP